MSRYWRLIGDYNGEATTFEALAGGFQTSPYTPDENCRLKGIRVIPSAEAATSLIEGVQIRLTCSAWKPNEMHIVVAGNGIMTALTPRGNPLDYQCDQPCPVGVQIKLEGRHAVATAVTNRVFVMGLFES